MKKLVFLLFFCVGIVVGQEAPKIKLSPEATISVITCGPGSELYSTFGHNAFRLKDPVYKYDMVYNYGTFDFNTPLFYIKFARGKLPYQLGRSRLSKSASSSPIWKTITKKKIERINMIFSLTTARLKLVILYEKIFVMILFFMKIMSQTPILFAISFTTM
jgi:hypothetical protein